MNSRMMITMNQPQASEVDLSHRLVQVLETASSIESYSCVEDQQQEYDPFLLPFQEVTKEEYFSYERQKKRRRSQDNPSLYCNDENNDMMFAERSITPSPTPALFHHHEDAKQWLAPPVFQSLYTMMLENKPAIRRELLETTDDLTGCDLKKDPCVFSPPPISQSSSSSTTIVLEDVPSSSSSSSSLTNKNKPGSPNTSATKKRNRQTSTSSSSSSGETRRAASSEFRQLPKTFLPGPWSVIIGRDKASLQATGNRRLHMIVRKHLENYSKCGDNKVGKTQIISDIENMIRRNCCGGGEQQEEEQGAFIKFQDGQWWEVNPWLAREKIGRMLRESLHTKYSSSSRRKRARRRLLNKTNSNNSAAATVEQK